MEYKHFGMLLKDLREKYNMSREELAEGVCSPKQIYRIEKGISEPSIYILNQMSLKFNLDLNDYYKMYFSAHTLSAFEGIRSINSALESNDLHQLKLVIEQYENHKDFKKGENLQHIYYGKALCSALLDEDYMSSLEYCYKGIRVEYPNFDTDKVTEYMYSNAGIAMLNCISQNYFSLDNYTEGMKVLSGLLNVLETYVLNSSIPLLRSTQFSVKIYQTVLYNMGYHLFEHGEIERSQYFIDKGIDYSIREQILRLLPSLLLMKFKICYSEKQFNEAQEYYNQSTYLAKLTSYKHALKEIAELKESDYPEIKFKGDPYGI